MCTGYLFTSQFHSNKSSDKKNLSTDHPAPHGRSEEEILVLYVEIVQAVFLKGGGEVLGLWADQLLVGVEVLGDEGEVAPGGGPWGQVVGLDGELDVQHLGVGAQHLPRHVHLDKHQFFVHDLQSTTEFRLELRGRKGGNGPVWGAAPHVQILWPPAPFPSSSSWPQSTRVVSAEKRTGKGLNELLVWKPPPPLSHPFSAPDVNRLKLLSPQYVCMYQLFIQSLLFCLPMWITIFTSFAWQIVSFILNFNVENVSIYTISPLCGYIY